MTFHDRTVDDDPIITMDIAYQHKSGRSIIFRITDPDVVDSGLEYSSTLLRAESDMAGHYHNGHFFPYFLTLKCLFSLAVQHSTMEALHKSPEWLAGACDNQAAVDEGLSPAARDVRCTLEALARSGRYKSYSTKELVTALARIYATKRLRKRHRKP